MNKGANEQEVGTSGAAPPPKRQRVATSEADVIGEGIILEPFTKFGQFDKGKAGITVLRDSVASSDYTEVTQAIVEPTSSKTSEKERTNKTIRDRYKAELGGYVEKYHTRLSASINADTESLVLSMAEAILYPNSDVPSYKVLELAIDMQKVSVQDMSDLF